MNPARLDEWLLSAKRIHKPSLGLGKSHGRKPVVAGFTLLETLVALIVIVGGILGPFVLASYSIGVAKFSRNELIAANLAAEGIELVHGFRTSNVLSGAAWDAQLGLPDASREYRIDPICSAAPCTPNSAPNFRSCTEVDCAAPLLLDTNTGLYSYQDCTTANCATPFVRRITIDRRTKPGNPYFDDRATPELIPAADQMTVISRVTWTDNAIARHAEVAWVLYNWR